MLQVELEGLQAEPALARNAWAQQAARMSSLEERARAQEGAADAVRGALGGIVGKVRGWRP